MSSIATNADGSITVSFDNDSNLTADQVILCMSFSVLRTLNYKKAGFDALKQTAITRLGSGLNVKLNLQFTARPSTDVTVTRLTRGFRSVPISSTRRS